MLQSFESRVVNLEGVPWIVKKFLRFASGCEVW